MLPQTEPIYKAYILSYASFGRPWRKWNYTFRGVNNVSRVWVWGNSTRPVRISSYIKLIRVEFWLSKSLNTLQVSRLISTIKVDNIFDLGNWYLIVFDKLGNWVSQKLSQVTQLDSSNSIWAWIHFELTWVEFDRYDLK